MDEYSTYPSSVFRPGPISDMSVDYLFLPPVSGHGRNIDVAADIGKPALKGLPFSAYASHCVCAHILSIRNSMVIFGAHLAVVAWKQFYDVVCTRPICMYGIPLRRTHVRFLHHRRERKTHQNGVRVVYDMSVKKEAESYNW